jgi:3-phenylpropionate/trans-cinnamate dioxygenase ferredoxin reductase component
VSIPGGGVVIVGAGQAGGDVTGCLRTAGFAGSITLIGDEAYAPYRRPPLSKTFLAGEATLESLYIKSAAAYTKQHVDCHFGIGVEAIDRGARALRLFDGTTVPYEHLVLATGGRARRLSLPGAEHPNVHYVRTIDDILKLKEQFRAGNRLVIIGGGYIGLEAAAVGRKKELHVTLVEALPRVLARVTTPELSAFYERVHRGHGVDIRTGVGVHAFEGDPRVDTVVLADGTRLPADLIIVGIGLVPNTELADVAGLPISNGIIVDQFTRTADPNIYAIGDCSNHVNEFYPGRRLRLESVPNATEQARVCAGAICGKQTPYNALPWFWSDQYNLKLQMVGLSEGYDQYVVRGDMNTESFCVFYLRDGVLISADTVSRGADFMAAKRLINERVKVSPETLANESVPLKSLLEAKGG